MNYHIEGEKVVRDDWYIAVQHRTSNPTTISVSGVPYSFTPKKNVSLSWIAPEHIDKVLGEMAKICCGKTGKKFFPASLINVNIWTYGAHDGQR